MQTVYITPHANKRLSQRNLSLDDIQFVLSHGQRIFASRALHIFLGRCDIPTDGGLLRRYARLEGTVLVLASYPHCLILLTAYRNPRALKSIRCRARH